MNFQNAYLFFILLISTLVVEGQVVINEFSAANFDDLTDNFGEYEDWIELYNTAASPFDISGYYLSDKLDNPTKWQFPEGTIIGGNDYLVVYASKRNITTGTLHTNFALTQTRESDDIVFSDPTGALVDFHAMDTNNQVNHSTGRTTDGAELWSIFDNPTPNDTNTGNIAGYASTPIIDTEAGYYSGTITVSISSPDDDVNIYYTTNGNAPTTGSTLYTGPITISNTQVLRARAYSSNPNIWRSQIETNTYFIGEEHNMYVIAITGTNVDELLDGDWGAEPWGSFELFDENMQFLDESTGNYNKHGNDSWAYDQRGFDYISRDEFGRNYGIQHQIFPNKSRDSYQRLIVKAAANDNYPFEDGAHIRDAYIHMLSQYADLRLDERTSRPCVLYMNGQYWGLYDIREKVDDPDFTDYYYDQDKYDIDFIKTWGGTWEEYGSRDDWDDLHDFITTNDMTIPAVYDYVRSELNVGSLIDYMIINNHLVCMDWLNWNTGWWRGRNPEGDKRKWRYILWDMDASLGHYANYTGIPDTSPEADPCNIEDLYFDADFEGHTELLVRLMENEDFYAEYVNRYADLNNTYLSCDYMIALLDEMIAEIAPEMPRQVDRWGGTMAGWESEVEEMRNFILDRCDYIDGGMVDCYEVEGPYPLIVDIAPEVEGNIQINSIEPDSFPWTGDYFSGIPITLEADIDEDTGYIFDYWEVSDGITTEIYTEEIITLLMGTNGYVVTAHYIYNLQDVTFVVEPPGAGSININGIVPTIYPYTSEYETNSLMGLTVIPNDGFTFNFWEAYNSTISPSVNAPTVFFTVTSADTIVAHFTPDIPIYDVSINVAPNDGGSVLVDGTTPDAYPYLISVEEGTAINIEALAAMGLQFDYWEVNGSVIDDFNNPNANITITADTEITAYFTDQPSSITIITEPVGAASVSLDNSDINLPYTAIYENGTVLNLILSPNEGYALDTWSSTVGVISPDATISTISYTVQGNDTIIASLVPSMHEITIVVTNPNLGVITANGETVSESTYTILVPYGEQVNLSAIPNSGFVFGSWEASNIITGTASNSNIAVLVNGDATINVSFRQNCKPAIPSAFSPNGDGTNDEFKMHMACEVSNFQILIYNRWGNQVFSSNDPTQTWDGTFNGETLNMGVYPYFISYEIEENGTTITKQYKGNITLLF